MGKPWSIREETYLKANYEKLKITQIAKHLDRTEKAVKGKAKKLGLKKYDVTEGYKKCIDARHEIEARMKMQGYGVNVKTGDKVKIVAGDYDSKRYRTKRRIRGKIIFRNKSYLVVDTGRYKECFLFSDFYTGEAQII